MSSNNTREGWIDFIKGIMIVIVVLGHNNLPPSVIRIIYMFHMPFFFVLSGYLYREAKDFKGFVIKKAKKLIYPYFVFGFLIVIWNTVLARYEGSDSLFAFAKRIIALLYGNYIWENNYRYIGTLWFLVALFCTEIYFFLIAHSKNKNLTASIIVVLGIGLLIIRTKYLIRLPWCMDIASHAVLFLIFGSFCKTVIEKYNPNIIWGGGNRIIRFCFWLYESGNNG